jgi:ribosome-binding factor A
MHEIDRTRRVAELMKRELAILISQNLNDKRINTVTITSVTVSKDLRQSKVFFSTIQDEDKVEIVEKLLNNSAGYLRHQLGKTLKLRIMPTIEFKFDNSLKRGIEMSTLIDRLNSNNGG